MADLSRITYTADGTTQIFGVPFPFLQQADVDVEVNGTSSTFSFDNDSTITVSSPTIVASDSVQVIRRTTVATILVDYVDGSGLPALDLDTTSLQLLYLAQEAFDDGSGAQISASAAAASAASAAADAVLTAADVVSTNADVVSTGNDVTSTNADVVSTGDDVTSTNADVTSTNADVALTNADVVSTNADVVLTNADVVSANNTVSTVASKYVFNTTTSMADPTAGLFRLNNATPASVTAIALDDQTNAVGNPDINAQIITWADSTSTKKGILSIVQRDDPTIFMIFDITGLTDNSGWTELAVTHVAGSTLFGSAEPCRIQFTRTGDKGDTGSFTAASQAEMEAGTDNTFTVTPLVANHHPSACKAWARYKQTTTAAISASYNISTITDEAAGEYRLNYSTNFSSGNYSIVGMANNATSNNQSICVNDTGGVPSTGNTKVRTYQTANNVATDLAMSFLAAFGDQ